MYARFFSFIQSFKVQQHPVLLGKLLSLNLEIQDGTDVPEETFDLDVVDLAIWFTPSVNQTPKPSDSLKQDRAESKDNRGSQEPKDWSRVNERSSEFEKINSTRPKISSVKHQWNQSDRPRESGNLHQVA